MYLQNTFRVKRHHANAYPELRLKAHQEKVVVEGEKPMAKQVGAVLEE